MWKNYCKASAVLTLSLFFLLGHLGINTAHATVRIKDIARVAGDRTNQLVGYGLVVGLSGTGDRRGAEFTIQSMTNMLERMGVRVDRSRLRVRNVAAVMVTAQMPVSSRAGSSLDVSVSSVGDASSLLGGVLLMTPLRGVDGQVYALAQGPLLLGGFSVGGDAAQAQKNITTVGLIPNGATVERSVPFQFNQQDNVVLHLQTNDFSTAVQVVDRINANFGSPLARAMDVSTIEVDIPEIYQGNLVPFIAALEGLPITPDTRARVVVDEKTGTVVVGQNVRLSKVAVAHGNLHIVVAERPEVVQPQPFSPGQTVVVPRTELGVREEDRRLTLLEGATLQDLVNGLNAIGATPRDLISILRTLKSAGALHAEVEVI
ncbi:flagellar basal body P-ring protein FlgI [Desulfonatronum thioautotrophicum]|uniref:flagellar basal body P-ring protein FlgI n=1 Tax=Desulfonatronum thioautotrophicum TaxID=617001 RepID=UPI00069A5CFC|nr:flagellar basal body P-ring protein FlgI [Desulfonatronum thioautotrophicum]